MKSRLVRGLAVCVALFFTLTIAPQADTAPQALPFSQDWSNLGLISADDNWFGVAGITGYRGDGLAGGTGVNPQTILGEGTPVVDVTANLPNPNTFATGGVAEFHLPNPVVALQGSGTARAPSLVFSVNTTGSTAIRVSYNLRDIDGSTDNAVQPVALQYRVGASGNFANLPAGFVADASTGPSLATLVTPVSVTLPAAADNQPLVQIRIITTDAVGSDEWIGIDDISVTGTGGSTNPGGTITAGPLSYSAGDPITLTVAVTPGTNLASTGITVTGNLASIGLGTPAFADQGNNTFTFNGTIPIGLSGGAKSISATITDANSPPRTGTTPSISVTILSPTAPTGSGSASPSSVPAGGTTQLTVNLTSGSNPPSSGLSVTGDLSAIGGGSAEVFQSGANNSFTFAATVNAATTLGNKTLPITIADSQGRGGGFTLSVDVTAALANSTIVISQVYGGGGNSGATYQNDYVQLYNRSAATVDITGWSLQYASATGSNWDNKQPLGGTIDPGQYYLVALASGGNVGATLPLANISGDINMGATAGKIALVDNGDSLSGPCPVGDSHARDLVGYGGAATCREGATNAPAASNTTALLRQGGGFLDTNNNGNDFVPGTPAPTTTQPIIELGPQVLTTDPRSGATTAPRDATIQVTFTEAVDVHDPWFDLTCTVTGPHHSATTAGAGKGHYITPNDNFQAGESCTVRIFRTQVTDQDTDDSGPHKDTLPADYVWSFRVATGTAPPYSANVHLTMGNPSGAVASIGQPNNYLMEKPEFALSYNRDLGRPNWVSWHLSTEWTGTLTRVDTFRADPAVPPDWYRVQSFDFFLSGFDRGHMVPNADRDKETSIPINQATFLMSNMVAQAPDNNQGPWADLENYLRTLNGDPLNPSEIYVVAGPAGIGGTGSNGSFNTIAGGRVTVPASTWKVALVLPVASGDDISRVSCSTRTIAVIMPNVQGIRGTTQTPNPWTNYLINVDEVEALTGYNFFSHLPEPIQHCVEAGINGNNPKNDQSIAFAQIDPHHFGDGDFAVDASASSGLTVNLSVVSGPATLAGGRVHITGVGTVTIRASQPGDVTYNPAPDVEQSFTVAKATQTITFDAPADRTYCDGPFTASAAGGTSGNPVTFRASGACTSGGANGATITIVSAGACPISASQGGSDLYDAATSVDQTLTVSKADASIAVTGYSGVYDGSPHGAAGLASGLGGESLTALLHLGATFTNAPGGTASWSFDGNTNYNGASGTVAIVIEKAAPVFSAIAAPTVEAGAASTTLSGRITLGSLTPTGSVLVTLHGVTHGAPINPDGTFTATFASASLAPLVYVTGFSYAGDGNFIAAVAAGSLTVTDTIAPAITGLSATPAVLGPPNHKMIDIALTYQATDATGAPGCSVSVASNEPLNRNGDGNTSVDWQVLDARHLRLRAERAGGGSGRLYIVTVTCADASGNAASRTVTVAVPK